jgi:hypothetical protein
MTEPYTTFDLLVGLRGGLPDACDFCGQPYTEARWPEPEEAGAWACSECVARWDEQRRAEWEAQERAEQNKTET